MKKTIVQCDICGGVTSVISATFPMYRRFDATEGRAYRDYGIRIVFENIDICEECLKKCTNIFDQRVMGYGDIVITTNPTLH